MAEAIAKCISVKVIKT